MSLHPRANNSVREAKGKEIHSSMVSVIKGKNSVMGENIKENMILNGGVGDLERPFHVLETRSGSWPGKVHRKELSSQREHILLG